MASVGELCAVEEMVARYVILGDGWYVGLASLGVLAFKLPCWWVFGWYVSSLGVFAWYVGLASSFLWYEGDLARGGVGGEQAWLWYYFPEVRCRKETESGLEWEVCGEGREGEQGVTLAVCDLTFMARTEHRCGGLWGGQCVHTQYLFGENDCNGLNGQQGLA